MDEQSFIEDEEFEEEYELVTLNQYLPIEIKIMLFEFLDISKLHELIVVCKEWKNLLCSERMNFLWEKLVYSHIKDIVFLNSEIKPKEEQSKNLSNKQWRKLARLVYTKEKATILNYQEEKHKKELQTKKQVEDPMEEEDEETETNDNNNTQSKIENTGDNNNEQKIEQTIIPSVNINQTDLYNEDPDTIKTCFKERTIISKPIKASTVDYDGQNINQTRLLNRFSSFWSSTGSKTTNALEYGIYQLQDPFFIIEREKKLAAIKKTLKHSEFYKNLITKEVEDNEKSSNSIIEELDGLNEIDPNSNLGVLYIEKCILKVFKAGWQSDNIYPPVQFNISFGMGEDSYVYTSPSFPVAKSDDFQQFAIGPLLLVYNRTVKNDMKKTTEESKTTTTTTSNENVVTQPEERPQEEEEEEEVVELMVEEDEEIEEGEEDVEDEDEGGNNTFVITQELLAEAFMHTGGVINENFYNYVRQRITEEITRQREEREENKLVQGIKEDGEIFCKFNYIDKVQTQPGDNLYYTCLEFVDLSGSAFLL
ncbi:hypothetical protein ABK040_016203 [Willaertia magna]